MIYIHAVGNLVNATLNRKMKTEEYVQNTSTRSFCCPAVLSPVGDPLMGNGCGSPNYIEF